MYGHSTVSKPKKITGREVTSIANLLEGESSLVKKLEKLISLEMTAIVVNGHRKGFKTFKLLNWQYFRTSQICFEFFIGISCTELVRVSSYFDRSLVKKVWLKPSYKPHHHDKSP